MSRSVSAAILSTLLVAGHTVAQTPPAPAAESAEERVERLLGAMTLEEKIDLLGGVDDFFVRPLPRLGLPRLRMADGPFGVRNFGPATAMAAGIALAASWNPELVRRVGSEIGRDARAKGVHFLLAPGVNIHRAPMNGRNFEYLGEDPYLAARTAVAYIEGVQSQGVSATVKHFLGNNSEVDRHNSDSIIDDRTLREIYLPAFEAAVKEAHVGAVMDAYNLTNGQHMTQNAPLNVELLKKEWGFDGVLMSDWTSTYDAVAAANGGLDLEMPAPLFLNREKLLPAIQQGQVTVATIDDKVRRLLRTAARFGWLDREQADLSIPRLNPQGSEVALQAARESIVLLKNRDGLLPLAKERLQSIAVIGPDAHPAVPVGGGSARVQPFTAVSILEGLSRSLGAATRVYYHRGVPAPADLSRGTVFQTAPAQGERGLRGEYFESPDLKGTPILTRTEARLQFGGAGSRLPDGAQSARWTGYFVPASPGSHEVFVQAAGEQGGAYRLSVDDKVLFDNSRRALVHSASLNFDARPHKVVLELLARPRRNNEGRIALGVLRADSVVEPEAKAIAAKADVVVAAVGFDPDTESEGADRSYRLPPGQEQLILELLAANKNTIVAVTSGGGYATTGWLDKAPALLQTWYPGQEGGRALAEILLGEVNPSGRLPISFEARWADNPTKDSYYPDPKTLRILYKEGLFVGYRGYEREGNNPLFPFGHGLSYTRFQYGNLLLKPVRDGAADAGAPRYELSFDVTNAGEREGADVAQVYVAEAHPKLPRPSRELKAFGKVLLQPGETQRLSVVLEGRAFAHYDPDAKRWLIEADRYDLLVGRSWKDIVLRSSIAVAAPVTVR
jgi:beta-glucosidase